MTKRIAILLVVCTAFAVCGNAQYNKDDGWISLFDGKSLDGWKVGDNAESWKVQDGVIAVNGKGPSHLFYVGPVCDHNFKNLHFKA